MISYRKSFLQTFFFHSGCADLFKEKKEEQKFDINVIGLEPILYRVLPSLYFPHEIWQLLYCCHGLRTPPPPLEHNFYWGGTHWKEVLGWFCYADLATLFSVPPWMICKGCYKGTTFTAPVFLQNWATFIMLPEHEHFNWARTLWKEVLTPPECKTVIAMFPWNTIMLFLPWLS